MCITGNLQIFWSNDDLDMIEESSLYQETIKQKTQIEEDFLEIKPVSKFFFCLWPVRFPGFCHLFYDIFGMRFMECG